MRNFKTFPLFLLCFRSSFIINNQLSTWVGSILSRKKMAIYQLHLQCGEFINREIFFDNNKPKQFINHKFNTKIYRRNLKYRPKVSFTLSLLGVSLKTTHKCNKLWWVFFVYFQFLKRFLPITQTKEKCDTKLSPLIRAESLMLKKRFEAVKNIILCPSIAVYD